MDKKTYQALGSRSRDQITEPKPHSAAIYINACLYRRLPTVWNGQTEKSVNWRLIYNKAPGVSMRLNGQKIKLNSDNYYLIPFGTEIETAIQNKVQQFCIHFEAPQTYCRTAKNFYRFKLTELEKNMIDSIIPELRPGPEFTTPSGALLCTSLCALALAKIPTEDLADVEENQIVKRILGQVRNRLETKITIRFYAQEYEMKNKELHALFVAQTGITLKEYLAGMRLDRGQCMLESSSLGTREIAELICMPTTFARVFEEQTGCDPEAYQKAFQK